MEPVGKEDIDTGVDQSLFAVNWLYWFVGADNELIRPPIQLLQLSRWHEKRSSDYILNHLKTFLHPHSNIDSLSGLRQRERKLKDFELRAKVVHSVRCLRQPYPQNQTYGH